MSETPKELAAKIDQAQKVVAMEQRIYEPEFIKTRSAWETRIAQAKVELKDLKAKYAGALLDGSIAIFVVGAPSQTAKFAESASREGGTLTIDASSLYRRMAEPVDAALGREREFLPTHVGLIMQVMKEVGVELGLRSVEGFKYSTGAFLGDREAVVEHVRAMVRDAVGDDLNLMYIKAAIGEAATAARYTGSVVPVVVVNAHVDEVQSLSKVFGKLGGIKVIADDDEVDDGYVLAALKAAGGRERARGAKGEKSDGRR